MTWTNSSSLHLKLLEIEKRFLFKEKQEYSCAVVVVATPEGHYYKDANFVDEMEMDAIYQLAEENQPKCLFLTISGPGLKPLSISQTFSFENEQVVLGNQTEFEPAILNMLPNWP